MRTVGAFVFVLIALAAQTVTRTVHAQVPSDNRDSGAECLYVAARAFNCEPLLYEEFRSDFRIDQMDGQSVADLVEIADEIGLHCKPLRCRSSDLPKFGQPVVLILLLDPGHFALYLAPVAGAPGTSEAMVLFPGSEKVGQVDLADAWQGTVVAVSDRPIKVPTRGPGALVWVAGISAILGLAAGGWWFRRVRRVR